MHAAIFTLGVFLSVDKKPMILGNLDGAQGSALPTSKGRLRLIEPPHGVVAEWLTGWGVVIHDFCG